MNETAQRELAELASRFLSNKDRSISLVNEIEGLLIREFLETELFEELTEALALYRPGAAAPYVGGDEMAALLRDALERRGINPGDL